MLAAASRIKELLSLIVVLHTASGHDNNDDPIMQTRVQGFEHIKEDNNAEQFKMPSSSMSSF